MCSVFSDLFLSRTLHDRTVSVLKGAGTRGQRYIRADCAFIRRSSAEMWAHKILLPSGKFSLLSKDSSGRTLLSWATELGYGSVDDFGERKTAHGEDPEPGKVNKQDFCGNSEKVDANDMSTDRGDDNDDEALRNCEVCLMRIREADACHYCEDCFNGYFHFLCLHTLLLSRGAVLESRAQQYYEGRLAEVFVTQFKI